MTDPSRRPRVVIVGAGFGGLACARKLDGAPVDVLLLDRHNYHLFTPLLYQVATGLLNPSDIAYPLRAIFRRSRNVRFRQATVDGVDVGRRIVRLDDGAELPFDYLVLAAGSVDNYFGNQAVARVSIGLKALEDATRMRNHVLTCLERADAETDPQARRALLTFVVVGGGPTGVECSGRPARAGPTGRRYPASCPGQRRRCSLRHPGRWDDDRLPNDHLVGRGPAQRRDRRGVRPPFSKSSDHRGSVAADSWSDCGLCRW
ncbi:MAG: hypothetical protein E6J32_13030 [Chloroflexi bacterium]|nr:MAG: hypothetical protein E6J32_13030 [Chloroflexota bacterium]